MELFASGTHFIMVDGEESLWINRSDGSCKAKSGRNPSHDPGTETICLGTVYGFIGMVSINPNTYTRLIFIRQRKLVGRLRGCEIYAITSVSPILMEIDSEVLLEPCLKSSDHKKFEIESSSNIGPVNTSPSHENIDLITVSQHLLKTKVPAFKGTNSKKIEKEEKLEKRIMDEFQKLFTEADSFYYSMDYDITNSMQRLEKMKEKTVNSAQKMLFYEQSDRRFFWNWHMLECLINSKEPLLHRWIQPIMQGFVQTRNLPIDDINAVAGIKDPLNHPTIDLWLISRRSRFQAGTRYLRRGIDENGKVANYVETEQILTHRGHICSFVIARGSIPLFWSQSNRYRYRPPPKLEKTDEESYSAFLKHFEEELSIYERETIITLVEKTGKEKVIGDAYLKHILRFNSPNLIYVSFDFHEACRGMKFENIRVLIKKVEEIIKNMGYTWMDSYGMICQQRGIFRVNCVDCIDRTNVVQMHLARDVLHMQLSKLGLIIPECRLPNNIRQLVQTIWANNGDTISKQYAGTNALKGDFTRTGERKITGVMKDGMNSANRYYLNRFRDSTRQAVIDLMLGVTKEGEEIIPDEVIDEKQPEDKESAAEQIKLVIDDVKHCVVPDGEGFLGSWGLVNAKISDPGSLEVDVFLYITRKRYFVIEYDWTMDCVTDTQEVDLLGVRSIILGVEAVVQPQNLWSIFNTGNSSNLSMVPNLTVNYNVETERNGTPRTEEFTHEFRSSSIRFFNTVAIPIEQPEEMHESLRLIAESIRIACEAIGNHVPIMNSKLISQKQFFKPRIPSMATNWVNKYFVSGQPENDGFTETPIPFARKITSVSIERFTPKYFRRGSNSILNSQEVYKTSGTNINSDPTVENDLQDVQVKKSNLLDLANNQQAYPDLIDFSIRTLNEDNSSICMPTHDLVLSSCGIISLPRRKLVPINSSHLSPLLLLQEQEIRSGTDIWNLPVTPASGSISPYSILVSKPLILSEHRHRCSLPTNSLQPDASMLDSVSRSKTPEITITEEPQSQLGDDNNGAQLDLLMWSSQGTSKISNVSKRICRSYEDVNRSSSAHDLPIEKVSPSTLSSGFKLPTLFPLRKKDSRGGSQQDIPDSIISMKGSHSDNALREHPFQSSNVKRDIVLAPLGKLARGMQNLGASYLDPRKLRDSFKPVAKKEEVEDPTLEEMKKQSQTLIIEV